MKALLLSIESELAVGQTVDTNSAWLAARLARLAVKAGEHSTLADDAAAITDAIGRAADRVGPGGLLLITEVLVLRIAHRSQVYEGLEP